MLRGFLKHSGIYSLGIILTRGISFLLLPLYTRVLTPHDYGFISLLSSAAALIVPFLSLELTQAIGIYYSESRDYNERVSYVSTAFWFILISNSIYLAFFYCCYCAQVQHSTIFLIVFVATVITTLYAYLQSQLLWQQKAIRYSLINIASVIITILLTLYFVLKLHWGPKGVFLASLWGNLVGAICAFCYNTSSIRVTFDLTKLKKLLSFSLPLIPSNLGLYAFLYIDQLVVNHFLGLASGGIYAVACRFVMVVNLLLYAVGSALPPIIYQSHQNGQTKISLEMITRLFMVLGFLIVLGLLLGGRDIIMLFTTSSYMAAANIIPLLALSTLLININIFAPGLIIRKKSVMICYLNIAAAIINLLLCFALVPKFGIVGAAMGSLLSAILFSGGYITAAQNNYYISYHGMRYAAAAIVFVLLYLSFDYFDFTFSYIAWMDLLLKMMLLIPIGFVFLALLCQRQEWQQLGVFSKSQRVLN